MEGILFEDREGNIVFANAQALAVLGIEESVMTRGRLEFSSEHPFPRFLKTQEGYQTRTGGRWQWGETEVTMIPVMVGKDYLGSIITLRETPDACFIRLKDLSNFIFTVWSLGLKGKFSWEQEGKELLKYTVLAFDLEWSAVFLFSEEDTLYEVAEWSPLKEWFSEEKVVFRECFWLREQIKKARPLFFPVFADFPREAQEERAFFERHLVRSLVLVPLVVNGDPLGVMVGATVTREKEWGEKEKRNLEFLGWLLAHIGRTSQVATELNQAQEFLHIILNETPDVICLKDWKSRFVWTSRFHLQVMGVAHLEDVVGKTDFDFFPPEEARIFFQDEQRVMETGEPLVNKLEQAHFADGRLHWMMTTKIPVRNERGEIVGVLAIARDVTQLKEVEEKLSWEKNLFLSIINTIPDHVYVKDREHRFLLVNTADARHHGFASPQEMVGKTDFDLHPPELAWSYWEEEEERMLTTGETILNDERRVNDFSTGEKRKIWISTNKAPLYDDKGKIVGMVGINRNITERKEMEEALKESEREKVLILNALQDQVTYYDPDFRIIWVNQAVLENFGFSPHAIIGKRCYEVIENRNAPCPGCAVARAFKSGRPEEGEVIARNGTIWHQKAYPILDENGKVFRVVEVSMNITERKKAEEKIRYLSFHDTLTGLYNRLFFQEELRRLDVSRQLPLSIIMGDVNNLKLVNDAFGHEAGDELLRKIALVLLRSCRKEDIVARWGGDEFLILLPKTSSEVAREIIERIRRLCQEESERIGGNIPLSISLGCATKEKKEEAIQDIINEAESRMYRNKLVESRSARSVLIVSLERSLWEISEETEVHSQRLKDIALRMGAMLGLSTTELDALELLARLHDLGKLGVARSILTKPGPLDEKEWEEIKRHPDIGYRIAQVSPELLPVAEGILTHHERFDGSGYPQGLKGEEIPL
ncbi:MAG: PAS domain-containing protein, partial [Candidatus Atribacteria bacterium]|nr:PAS domain-containing protein [Candidatus Atribacteria bacterium]